MSIQQALWNPEDSFPHRKPYRYQRRVDLSPRDFFEFMTVLGSGFCALPPWSVANDLHRHRLLKAIRKGRKLRRLGPKK